MDALIVVSMKPGEYVLTVMLCCANSAAVEKVARHQHTLGEQVTHLPALCVKPRIANLEALYADKHDIPTRFKFKISGRLAVDSFLTLLATD